MSFGYRIAKLSHRGLLQVTGSDAFPYIQSIFTNDLRSSGKIIYGTFLNAVGRVLLDMMVYKYHGNPSERQLMLNAVAFGRYGIDGDPEDSLLIECDSNLLEPARKTLFAYKVRRDVTISHANGFELFAIYPDVDDVHKLTQSSLPQLEEVFSSDLIIARDPRVGPFSYRIVSRLGHTTCQSILPLLSHQIPYPIETSTVTDYHNFRYKMAIAEGKDDYRPCFADPTEANIDYMNGLSLTKGQFTGKAVIARHGIKFSRLHRFTPVEFLLPEESEKRRSLNTAFGTRFLSSDGQKLVGKLVNRHGRYGLAVLKSYSCLESGFRLRHLESGVDVKTWFPGWWPQTLLPKHYYLAKARSRIALGDTLNSNSVNRLIEDEKSVQTEP